MMFYPFKFAPTYARPGGREPAAGASSRCVPAAPIADSVAASSGADSPSAGGVGGTPLPALDHRLSDGTDELWLALVRRLS